MFTEHKGFVQGVAIDPLGQYLATLSDDRLSALCFANVITNVLLLFRVRLLDCQ